MTGKNGNGVWKWMCGIVCTAFLAVIVSWKSFGGGVTTSEASRMIQAKSVDRAEVSQMIQTEAPYIKDKAAINVRLKHIEDMVTRIDETLHK